MNKDHPFEQSMAELEQAVHLLEQGELTLEESLKLFEKGIGLARQCQEALNQAEQKIEILTATYAPSELKGHDDD